MCWVEIKEFFYIICNSLDYTIEPQWFFTSPELCNYMKIAVKKWDLMKVSTKLEAFAIARFDIAR